MSRRGIRGRIEKAAGAVVDAAGETADRLLNLVPTGISGLKRSGGYVYDEFHPRLYGKKAIKTYREMADNDAVCGSILWSQEAFVRQAPWNLNPEDEGQPEAVFYRDRIHEMFNDMSHTPQEMMSDVMSMVWAGYSWHEIVYKIRRGNNPLPQLRSKHDDGLVGVRKIEIRAQESIERWDFADDGGVTGAWQQAWPDFRMRHLDINKSLLFRIRANKSNPEGRSLLRNAHRSWWFLKRIQELEAIGVERDMAGLLVFEMPPEFFSRLATPKQLAAVSHWRKILQRARRGEYDGLLFPAEQDKNGVTGWKARLMQSGGRRPMDVDGIIKRLESRIALSVLGEAVLLGMQGNVGSWSLASSKTHMFAVALKAEMDAIADVFNRFLIPRIMELNNWPLAAAPRYEFGDIENDDALELINALSSAASAGIIVPDRSIETYLRKRMGLPAREDIDMSSGQAQDAVGAFAEHEKDLSDGEQDLEAEDALSNVIPIQPATAPSETLSANDAAQLLGVSRAVINRAISSGQLPGNKVGGGYRVFRSDLMAYMRSQRAA